MLIGSWSRTKILVHHQKKKTKSDSRGSRRRQWQETSLAEPNQNRYTHFLFIYLFHFISCGFPICPTPASTFSRATATSTSTVRPADSGDSPTPPIFHGLQSDSCRGKGGAFHSVLAVFVFFRCGFGLSVSVIVAFFY